MSQAVIDFCHGLQTTLLTIEDRLAKARKGLAAGAETVETEATKHVDEASEQLAAFRAKAATLAASLRDDIPEKVEEMQDRLAQFGLEAQTATRHAVVFMAEAASHGTASAAGALNAGAGKAHHLAEQLRRETALTAPKEQHDTSGDILPT